jgi:ribosomal protein S18 acetylase RimI-like enzyme
MLKPLPISRRITYDGRAMVESMVALELAEMEAVADLYRAASSEVVAASGLSVVEVADAILIAVNQIDVLALNRLIGLGLRGSPSDSALAGVLNALEGTGSPRCFVPVAPSDGYENLSVRIERLGLRHYNNWMRLRRDLDDLTDLPTAPSTPLEVRQIDSADAHAFGHLVATAFEYPPAIAPLAAQPIGRPRWYHYLAFEGNSPIASGAMYVTDEAAWFGFAATDAAHRRRGAQQALIIRRLKDAASAGCRWVSVETAEDTVTKGAPSFRNLRRLGFEVAYRRPNYLWSRPSAGH